MWKYAWYTKGMQSGTNAVGLSMGSMSPGPGHYDVIVLGSSAMLADAVRIRGLSAENLPDPLQGLPGWAATGLVAPAVTPWLVTAGFSPGFSIECLAASGPLRFTCRALVVQVGQRERLMPFPGCLLPGVGGLGMPLAAGEHVLVVGPQPWREAACRRCRDADATMRLAPEPQRVAEAAVTPAGLQVRLADAAGNTGSLPTQRLMVADGFLPATDVLRLLRAAMRFDPGAEAWLPRHDAAGRCSVPLLYAAHGLPDVAGLAETIAADLARDAWPVQALSAPEVSAASGNPAAAFADPSVVCPCEEITAGAVRMQATQGLRTLDQLKSATRCGMGACGGRWCEDAASRVLAAASGQDRAAVGYWSGRAPLVPVPLRALTGAYTYADIPIPAAAPL
jgi:bacterioferritin-associated ferredoxin